MRKARTAVILASASPARLSVLRAAGLDPVVRVSGVDEETILAANGHTVPSDRVGALAQAKAVAVAAELAAQPVPPSAQFAGVRADTVPAQLAGQPEPEGPAADAVIIGCDSMLLVDGVLLGKPHTPERAREIWSRTSGRDGELLTGHAVLRMRNGTITGRARQTRRTVVRMAEQSEAELTAYLATGEPLEVAGAFTIDGYGGWFVEGIDGDPSNVLGLSLPLLRRLLAEVGIAVTDLWRPA